MCEQSTAISKNKWGKTLYWLPIFVVPIFYVWKNQLLKWNSYHDKNINLIESMIVFLQTKMGQNQLTLILTTPHDFILKLPADIMSYRINENYYNLVA